MSILKSGKQFRESLEKLSRDDLLEIIRIQDPELIKQINRIEWVFANKLSHLNWPDGTPVTERPFSIKELTLLVDEPFEIDKELNKIMNNFEKEK
mgnify:CR=1 FL=1